MFNKDKTQSERFAPINATLISSSTTLNGDVHSDNDLRIDGTIKGNVSSSGKIIIGATGYVEGKIEGQYADITGKVEGNIIIKELLQLRAGSLVKGNITPGKLQIDPSAIFNGECHMGTVTTIVQMNNNEFQTEAR